LLTTLTHSRHVRFFLPKLSLILTATIIFWIPITKFAVFFEEDAFSTDGELQQAKARSINKIRHALHVLSPEFAAFSQAMPLHYT
jgi:uncharacterized Zn finger protein